MCKCDYITEHPGQHTIIKQLEGSNVLVDYHCTSLLVSLTPDINTITVIRGCDQVSWFGL